MGLLLLLKQTLEMSNRKFNVGFTLVEVIVSIAILMIISGLGILSLNKINKDTSADNDAELVKQVLISAYTKATAVIIPLGCTKETIEKYKVTMDSGSDELKVEGYCSGAVEFIAKEKLTSGTFADNYVIEYKAYTGELLSNNSGAMIKILDVSGNDSRYITVGEVGIFNISSPTPSSTQ